MRGAARFWNRMYRTTPSWELGRADPTLIAALDERGLHGPGRALDIGCGTGDNAIALAARGFEVTGIDIAERALDAARAKARTAGLDITFIRADITATDALTGTFDVVVDRGLLMSLFGEHARQAYTAAVTRLTAPDGAVYLHQWELPQRPRVLSAGWWAMRVKGLVVAPGELERRFGEHFHLTTLARSVEPTDDKAMRRVGLRWVAKTSTWMQRES